MYNSSRHGPVLALLLLRPQTKFGDLVFLHRFLLLLLLLLLLYIIIIIIIIIIYYYYYSSSSSRCELVRPNSQRLIILSLPNFTGRWIPISRGAIRSWNFGNGRRCHGNREHMSKSLTSLISETAKGFPQDLSYILSRVGRIF